MKAGTIWRDSRGSRLVEGSRIVLLLLALMPRGASGQDATPITASPTAATDSAAIAAFYQPPVSLPPGDPGTLLRWEPLTAPDGVRAWRILYRSAGLDGQPVAVSGALFAPAAPAPPGGFPLIAMGHNSTGTARQCAPSRDPFAPQFGADEAFFAEQVAGFVTGGFAVVATDYQGWARPAITRSWSARSPPTTCSTPRGQRAPSPISSSLPRRSSGVIRKGDMPPPGPGNWRPPTRRTWTWRA